MKNPLALHHERAYTFITLKVSCFLYIRPHVNGAIPAFDGQNTVAQFVNCQIWASHCEVGAVLFGSNDKCSSTHLEFVIQQPRFTVGILAFISAWNWYPFWQSFPVSSISNEVVE